MSGDLVRRDDVGTLVGRLSADDLERGERGRLLGRLTRALASGVRSAGAGAALSGRYLVDVVSDVAPHIPVRDLATLSAHHEGRTGDALAAELVSSAARTTAAIGAAGGALAAVEMAAPPSLLAAPVQLVAETVAVVAVELKLVAELHVVYGRPALGGGAQQAAAYLTAWATKRGVDITAGAGALPAILGTAARQQLRARLIRRLGRNVTTLAPFLAGAVAGAELNRRETRKLGDQLVEDLRTR
jgi:hypothetical protein